MVGGMDFDAFCGLFLVLPALLAVIPAVWIGGMDGFVLWLCIACPVLALERAITAFVRNWKTVTGRR